MIVRLTAYTATLPALMRSDSDITRVTINPENVAAVSIGADDTTIVALNNGLIIGVTASYIELTRALYSGTPIRDMEVE